MSELFLILLSIVSSVSLITIVIILNDIGKQITQMSNNTAEIFSARSENTIVSKEIEHITGAISVLEELLYSIKIDIEAMSKEITAGEGTKYLNGSVRGLLTEIAVEVSSISSESQRFYARLDEIHQELSEMNKQNDQSDLD